MQLHKTGADIAGAKKTSEQTVKNISPKNQVQAAKTSAPVSTIRSASSLAAAAGLPNDKLSASIVAFARFFSLPLKPQTLTAIRRRSFSPQGTPAPASQQTSATTEDASATAAKTREALSLSAAAAESKGVELSSKALQTYAEAVDPEWRKNQDESGQKKQQRKKDQNEKDSNKTIPISASSLEKIALQSARINPLLDILNRLPGKNGQRWIVLPFDFPQDESELKVSMRILLDEMTPDRAVCMALDIAENANDGRRWSFMMEPQPSLKGEGSPLDYANEKPFSLTCCFRPGIAPNAQSRLKRELSSLLEIPPERVHVKNADGFFPCETERSKQFPSIDEAV